MIAAATSIGVICLLLWVAVLHSRLKALSTALSATLSIDRVSAAVERRSGMQRDIDFALTVDQGDLKLILLPKGTP